MRLAVMMSYHDRQKQLDHTLVSMANSVVRPQLVLVNDADPSGKGPYIHECWHRHPKVIRLETLPQDKFWTSVPVIPMNRGIQAALDWGADVIVLQSPECRHVGDVLAYVEQRMRRGTYMTFACLSLCEHDTFDPFLAGKEREIGSLYSRPTASRGGNGWFNHSAFRPSFLEFCAAIHRDDVIKVNGYDERFATGVGCGDCDLLRRVRNAGIEPIIVDDPFVVHQWHYHGSDPYTDAEGWKRNQELLAELEKVPSWRAVHTHTRDLR